MPLILWGKLLHFHGAQSMDAEKLLFQLKCQLFSPKIWLFDAKVPYYLLASILSFRVQLRTVAVYALTVRAANHYIYYISYLLSTIGYISSILGYISSTLGYNSSTLDYISSKLGYISSTLDDISSTLWLHLVHTRFHLIHTRLDLVHAWLHLIPNYCIMKSLPPSSFRKQNGLCNSPFGKNVVLSFLIFNIFHENALLHRWNTLMVQNTVP